MSLCASAQLLVMQVPDWPTYRWLGMSICSSLTPVAVPPAGTMGSQSLLVPPVSASASPVTKERPVKRLLEEIPGQMGHGPAGGLGQPVHRGGRLGPEPVLIPYLTAVEQIAWALSLRLSDVKLTFTSD